MDAHRTDGLCRYADEIAQALLTEKFLAAAQDPAACGFMANCDR
jgi:hypothetical protein